MKTLIIAGTYKITNTGVNYNVQLFGQSNEHPLCICLGVIEEELNNYHTLESVARNRYSEYFKTDLFNIISMSQLSESKR